MNRHSPALVLAVLALTLPATAEWKPVESSKSAHSDTANKGASYSIYGTGNEGGFEDALGNPNWQGWTCHDLSVSAGVDLTVRIYDVNTPKDDLFFDFYAALPIVGEIQFIPPMTSPVLAGVDLVIALQPDSDYTINDLTEMSALLAAGGRILFVGENASFPLVNARINTALAALGSSLSIGSTTYDAGFNTIHCDAGQVLDHPLAALVQSIRYASVANILGSTPSQRILLTQDLSAVWAAEEQIGNGSIVLITDNNIIDSVDLPGYDNGRLLDLFLDSTPSVGAFCKIFENLSDLDPTHDNLTPQATFIDDGTPVAGCYAGSTGGATSPTWAYGTMGAWVVNFTGGLSFGQASLHNEIWSPQIDWDLPGTEDDLATQLELSFDVYEHNPLLNGIFWTWRVRSFPDPVTGDWSDWQDRNFVYYSETARYATKTLDLSDLLVSAPTKLQVALGVIDLAAELGYAGIDATPAPWFDNVGLSKIEPALLETACTPELPSHDRTVTFGSRGMWFEAPTDLRIVGMRAPSELTGGDQAIEILDIHADPSSFESPASSTDFTSLVRVAAQPGNAVIPLSIDISAGTRVGILGGRTPDGTATHSSYSSYLPGPFATSLGQHDIDLFRLASAQSVASGAIQSIFYSPFSELGRIELYVERCDALIDCACTRQWSALAATVPSARSGHGMVYDAARDEILLFGGYDGVDFLGDTWAWNGSAWMQRTPMQSPSARSDFGMCYDSARQVVVLYGGSMSMGKLGDTWEWDGSDWTNIATANSSEQSSMGLSYDATRQLVVRYGGDTASGRSRSTYEYDGSTWSTISNNSAPGYRSRQIMVFDPDLDAVVVFGGQAPGGTLLADTWTYNGTWTPLAISGPSARQLARADLDASCGGIYVHGGITASGDADDLWKLVGGVWTGPLPSAPTARHRHGLAYDAGRAALVLFAGNVSAAANDELWRFGCQTGGVTAIEPSVGATGLVARMRVSPNPFNPRVTIQFELAQSAFVQADIFDLRGHHVRNLLRAERPAGSQSVVWDGRNDAGQATASGVYIVRVRSGAEYTTRKLTLLR